MEKSLRELIDGAVRRGNKYVKGDTTLGELPEKIAELGVFLLEKASKLESIGGERLREELIEIQNKLDDSRKAVFSNKIKIT
jgi:hypothetical protein